MAYTTIDKPSDYFNTVLYTGNGNQRNITGVGFQPDWIWGKNRSATGSHNVIDSVRGVSKIIYTNLNDAEATDTSSFNAFGSDGFSVGSQSNVNGNGNSIVAWNWKAGTSFTNDASATGIGTIDSAGSASDASGFSIVSYTGTESAGTIKHGLSSVPKMIIAKDRDSGSLSWFVGHASLGFTKRLKLDGTNEAADNTVWNNTNPTSSVFSVGSSANANTNGNAIIAYCFAEKQGYSKFSSYTGNGNADGTFVYTGFKPAFILAKDADSSDNWIIHDTTRNPSNPVGAYLRPNLSSAEGTFSHYDILSNGFKNLYAGGSLNGSGKNIIYMAFAENPFVTSTGIPATAR